MSDHKPTRNYREDWYCWREYVVCQNETKPRLIIPWSDPRQYEHDFDFLYKTPKEAHESKVVFGAEDEDWVLCKMTLEVVSCQTGAATE